MSLKVRMVPVRYANQSGRAPDKIFLPPEAAQAMVDAHLAVWNKKASAIILVKIAAEMYRAAPSLKPGVRIMEMFVAGNAGAIAIVNAWRMQAV